MKKVTIFLLIMIISFIFAPKINAYKDITSLPSSVSNYCDKNYCWPVYNSNITVHGMRVVLLKTDGTQVGKTANIISDYNHYGMLREYGNYYVLGQNCSKVQYEMGKCNVLTQTYKTEIGSPWSNGYLRVAGAVDPYFAHLNVSVKNNLNNWNIDDIWKWAEGVKIPLTDPKNVALYNMLFGLSTEEITNISNDPDLYSDLWIAIEPITMVRYKGKNYLGTSYELGHLGYVNWTYINSVFGRILPCAAVTTGEIITKYPSAPGTSAGNYFNGHLITVNTSEMASYNGKVSFQNVCAKTKGGQGGDILAEKYVTGNHGGGIGLVYFKDTFKQELSCAEVNNGISNYASFKSKLATTYRSSGLSGIYALPEVANGIKYTFNGKTETADKIWYINECTCYGLYDTYKSSTGVEIWTLTKGKIKTIFNEKQALFNTFVDNIKEQVKTIANTKPSTVGTVTKWDYLKYEENSCGYSTSYCEDVNFNNLREYSTGSWMSCYSSCNLYSKPWNTGVCIANCMSSIAEANRKNELINSCKRLPLYPSKSFNTDIINSQRDLYNQCFDIYNDQKGTSWNISSYQSAGCVASVPDIKKKYDCTPKYNVGTCINGENVYYNDSSDELNNDDYWKYCVFSDEQAEYDIDPHKWSNKNETLTYYDSNISSKYCEVYCIESLTGAFNSETIKVKAGQHFIWENHSVSGSRTCKTKSIEWDKFVTELSEMNNKIELAFNTWRSLVAQKATETQEYTSDCGCYCNEPPDPETGEGGCSSPPCPTNYYVYSTVTVNGVTSQGFGDCSSTTTTEPMDTKVENAKKEYEKIKNDAKNLYDQMKKCYNEDKGSTWISTMSDGENEGSSWDQWLYNVDPSAVVKYNYTINGISGIYSVDQEMDKNIVYREKENKNDCQTVEGGIQVLTSCDASTNKCTRKMLEIKKCTKVEMTKGATVEFLIPDGIYEYINKDGNISFNASQFETIKSQYISQGKSFNYIYLGYSNFPVEYKTPDGLYGKEYGNGELSITYSDLGYKLSGKKTAVDTILDVIDSAKYGNWQCQFEVVSELIPDENPDPGPDPGPDPESPKKGDIELIYRPIDLHDPFPDIDASGRHTGTNWCYGGDDRIDCSNTNEIVEKYILENRNVTGHEIYFEEPMYTFILTPAIINEIRKYNDNNSYADYYGNYGGETYDFKCNEGTGQTCISDYLTYIIDITGAKNLPGTCVADQYRTYNKPDAFDTCRY